MAQPWWGSAWTQSKNVGEKFVLNRLDERSGSSCARGACGAG